MKTLAFLQQVARYYASNEALRKSLCDIAFVLPNRRSAQQLEHYLAMELTENTMMPRLMSMNDMVDHIMRDSNPIIASPIETLFVAYQAYKETLGDGASSFDSFAHWGQLIVNDFNDVDMNLVDARALYTNLSDLNDIKSDYLDGEGNEELKDCISKILNIQILDRATKEKGSTMWKEDGVQGQYLSLWNCLAKIYATFGELLQAKEFTTQGKLYRDAVETLRNMSNKELGFDRIVMVGHDQLSQSERAIFKLFKNKGIADFWWDNASPALKNENNPAKNLLDELCSEFKSPAPIQPITKTLLNENNTVEEVPDYPEVSVNYVPSVVGMVKCAFENIDKITSASAIILPDEMLLEPLLNSLPDDKIAQYLKENGKDAKASDAINITMGYSLRRSNIATLIRLVTIAHKHASHNKATDEWMYYREDVRNILSHPIIKMAYTDTVLSLNNIIEGQKEFNIPASRFKDTPLEPLFITLKTDDKGMKTPDEVKQFINRLENFCKDLDDKIAVNEKANEVKEKSDKPIEETPDSATDNVSKTNENNITMSLQRAFINLYRGSLNQLLLAIDNVGLPVNDDTIFHLIDRVLVSSLVPFGGKSGKGIQVMGLLETRCIDFHNLNILSANEGTLPGKANMQTMIPDRFRAAFGMPTIALNDAIQVYRFYRLISRANNVTMYCNLSSDSEPSRFIEQMDKVLDIKVKRVKRTAKITTAKELAIKVDNNDEREKIKAKYTTGDINNKENPAACLSASSIKEFIKCPLKFYLHHVQGLSDDNPVSDFMDASQFGTIVHDTLQSFYYPVDKDMKVIKDTFNATDIKDFKKNRLDAALIYQINRTFNNKPHKERGEALSGQALILKETLTTFITRALDEDLKAIGDGSLVVLECEETHKVKLNLKYKEPETSTEIKEVNINFTFKSDRIDRIGNRLRIIDYKTGNDSTTFLEPNDFFNEANSHPEAIMQLFIYSMAYVQLFGDKLKNEGIEEIAPIIYKLSDTTDYGVFQKEGKAKSNKNRVVLPLNGFLESKTIINFSDALAKKIKELWEKPITQPQEAKKCCEYCNFTGFCRR